MTSLQDLLTDREAATTVAGKPRVKRSVSMVRNPEVTKLRAKFAVALQARGVSNTAIADLLGVTSNGTAYNTSKVSQLISLAAAEGWVTEVRERMVTSVLEKSEKAFTAILDADPETLETHAKGWALKAKVAQAVLQGTGTLTTKTNQVTAKVGMSLEQYQAMKGGSLSVLPSDGSGGAEGGGTFHATELAPDGEGVYGLLPGSEGEVVGGGDGAGGHYQGESWNGGTLGPGDEGGGSDHMVSHPEGPGTRQAGELVEDDGA